MCYAKFISSSLQSHNHQKTFICFLVNHRETNVCKRNLNVKPQKFKVVVKQNLICLFAHETSSQLYSLLKNVNNKKKFLQRNSIYVIYATLIIDVKNLFTFYEIFLKKIRFIPSEIRFAEWNSFLIDKNLHKHRVE